MDLKQPKVYQINDCDWYAGYDPDSCVKEYVDFYDGDPDLLEEYGAPTEVSDEAMNRMMIRDPDGGDRTFRQELDRMIEDGHKFPTLFASTEY